MDVSVYPTSEATTGPRVYPTSEATTGPLTLDMSLYPTSEAIMGPLTVGIEVTLALANLLPVCVACCTKRPRLATDELIAALSLTDITSVVVTGPLAWLTYFTGRWHGGHRACQFQQVGVVWLQLTSMCLITFLSFDRWMSLRDALTYRITPTAGRNRRVRVAISLLVLFTLGVGCLPLVGVFTSSESQQPCRSELLVRGTAPLHHVFPLVFLTVGYVNVATTTLVNGTVVATLWRFHKTFGKTTTPTGTSTAVSSSRAGLKTDSRSVVEFTVMVLVVSMVFSLAWLPALVSLTMFRLRMPPSLPDTTLSYCFLSTKLTGLLNPAIYGVFSRVYRRGYQTVLCNVSRAFGCCCCCPQTNRSAAADLSEVPQEEEVSHVSALTDRDLCLDIPNDIGLCSSVV